MKPVESENESHYSFKTGFSNAAESVHNPCSSEDEENLKNEERISLTHVDTHNPSPSMLI